LSRSAGCHYGDNRRKTGRLDYGDTRACFISSRSADIRFDNRGRNLAGSCRHDRLNGSVPPASDLLELQQYHCCLPSPLRAFSRSREGTANILRPQLREDRQVRVLTVTPSPVETVIVSPPIATTFTRDQSSSRWCWRTRTTTCSRVVPSFGLQPYCGATVSRMFGDGSHGHLGRLRHCDRVIQRLATTKSRLRVSQFPSRASVSWFLLLRAPSMSDRTRRQGHREHFATHSTRASGRPNDYMDFRNNTAVCKPFRAAESFRAAHGLVRHNHRGDRRPTNRATLTVSPIPVPIRLSWVRRQFDPTDDAGDLAR